MKNLFKRIIEPFIRAREEKRLKERRARIKYCILDSNIRYKDLIPIQKDDYNRLVSYLDKRAQELKVDEPYTIPSIPSDPNGHHFENIFAWREVVESMKSRKKEAYYIKGKPCKVCGGDNTVFFCYRSSDKSWRELYGREGYMHICPDCMKQISFIHYKMN